MRRVVPIAFLFAIACTATLYVRHESDTLYFGTAKPDGSVVTTAEWQQFLRGVVTPRFPGFTRWDAQGEWKGKGEETHVVVIVHQAGEEAKIREIVEEYKSRFRQEAVLQVREDVWIPRP
jgi:hypothetical protein